MSSTEAGGTDRTAPIGTPPVLSERWPISSASARFWWSSGTSSFGRDDMLAGRGDCRGWAAASEAAAADDEAPRLSRAATGSRAIESRGRMEERKRAAALPSLARARPGRQTAPPLRPPARPPAESDRSQPALPTHPSLPSSSACRQPLRSPHPPAAQSTRLSCAHPSGPPVSSRDPAHLVGPPPPPPSRPCLAATQPTHLSPSSQPDRRMPSAPSVFAPPAGAGPSAGPLPAGGAGGGGGGVSGQQQAPSTVLGPAQQARLADLLETVRKEFELLAGDAGGWKRERDDMESKSTSIPSLLYARSLRLPKKSRGTGRRAEGQHARPDPSTPLAGAVRAGSTLAGRHEQRVLTLPPFCLCPSSASPCPPLDGACCLPSTRTPGPKQSPFKSRRRRSSARTSTTLRPSTSRSGKSTSLLLSRLRLGRILVLVASAAQTNVEPREDHGSLPQAISGSDGPDA